MTARLAWITGAGGLIGSHLVTLAKAYAPGWSVRALRRVDLDLCDEDAVVQAFRADQPDLVIHCAAQSRSPACQADPTAARAINVIATQRLAELARGSRLIFFSTDLVFDGQMGNYNEAAIPRPLGVYAQTKRAAEKLVLSHPNHTVVRTSLNGGNSPTGDRGFDEQLRKAWEKGERTRLFTDEFRSPIEASLTARAVWELADKGLTGIFHVAGAERLSRWQIGQLVAARCAHLHPQIEPASLRDYAGAPRAPDTSLSCDKIASVLSFPLLGMTAWLNKNPRAGF